MKTAEIETYIEAVLTAAFTGTKTKVIHGYDPSHKEILSIWESRFTNDWEFVGQDDVREAFSIDLMIEVIGPRGKGYKRPTDRAWEIYEVLDQLIKADPHLDGVSFEARLSKAARRHFQTDQSTGCRIQTTLAGTARN